MGVSRRQQEKGENIRKTAEREIKEELGIEVEALEADKKYSWKAGGFEIVPVKATHNYEDADEFLELKEDKHGRYEWIDPEDYDENLGKEKNCLEAFNLV